jgi:hypothetical protein
MVIIANIKRRKESSPTIIITATTKVLGLISFLSIFTIGIFVGAKLFSKSSSTNLPLLLTAKSHSTISIQEELVHAMNSDSLKALAEELRDKYKMPTHSHM